MRRDLTDRPFPRIARVSRAKAESRTRKKA